MAPPTATEVHSETAPPTTVVLQTAPAGADTKPEAPVEARREKELETTVTEKADRSAEDEADKTKVRRIIDERVRRRLLRY
jgi:hypothetical protein